MEANSPQKDLAFLKALVNEGPKTQRSAGELFIVAGIVYGLQCLINGVQINMGLAWPTWAFIVLGALPTVIFLGWTIWLAWRNRRDTAEGVATRAMKSAFTSAGMANVAMCIVFGWTAAVEKNMLIWMLYPAVVSALQGACWYVAWMIRRKLWLAGVSAGWFATAVALGFLIRDPGNYLVLFSGGLFLLMGLPGLVMIRNDRAG